MRTHRSVADKHDEIKARINRWEESDPPNTPLIISAQETDKIVMETKLDTLKWILGEIDSI